MKVDRYIPLVLDDGISGLPFEADGAYTPMLLDIGLENNGDKLPDTMLLSPWGLVKTSKGDYLVDEEAAELVRHFHALRGNDVVIDYEHQALSGGEAPAAGWIKDLIVEPGKGIYVKPDWTPRALKMLKDREYRYWSPVIFKRESDQKLAFIHSVGLTNTPATFRMQPLINKMGIKIANQNKENTMKGFIAMLLSWAGTGLDKVADFFKTLDPELQKLKESTEQIAAKDLFPFFEKMVAREKQIAETQSGMVALKDIAGMLGLAEGAKITDIKGNIMALKQPSGKFVPVEDFNTLKTKLAEKDAGDLVAQALKDGKITAAQEKWALGEAKEDPDSFKVFLAAQPEIVPLKDRPGYKPPDKVPGGMIPDEVQLQVNKALGISKEDFEKYSKKGGE